MKKASATVIFDSKTNQIYNLTIKHKLAYINFIHYDMQAQPKPYKYPSFHELYQTVLNQAKVNGFYYDSYTAFNAIWYDIAWIDINNPTLINKYGFKKGE